MKSNCFGLGAEPDALRSLWYTRPSALFWLVPQMLRLLSGLPGDCATVSIASPYRVKLAIIPKVVLMLRERPWKVKHLYAFFIVTTELSRILQLST